MSLELEALIDDTLQLASLPEVVMRAIGLINDPRASAADIAEVVGTDPALTARLLQIVNSPLYGFPSTIDTVSRAITVIGTLELMDLIIASSVVKAFAGIEQELTDMDVFWEHSLYSGVIARSIAGRLRAPNSERYLVAGLLHDVGALALYLRAPAEASQALRRARDEGRPLHELEHEVLGFEHGEIGAALLDAWHLPAALVESARFHHRPQLATQYPLETAIVHVADIIASAMRAPGLANGRVPPLAPEAWDLLRLHVKDVEPIVAEADQLFETARSLILPGARAA